MPISVTSSRSMAKISSGPEGAARRLSSASCSAFAASMRATTRSSCSMGRWNQSVLQIRCMVQPWLSRTDCRKRSRSRADFAS